MPKYKYLYIRVSSNAAESNAIVMTALVTKCEKWKKFPIMQCIKHVAQNFPNMNKSTIQVMNYFEISKEDYEEFRKVYPISNIVE